MNYEGEIETFLYKKKKKSEVHLLYQVIKLRITNCHYVPLDLIQWEGHVITSVVFLQKFFNQNLIMRK